MLLSRLLKPFIRVGKLTVIDADGRRNVFGCQEAPAVTIRLHDRSLHWRLALNAELCAGEAYMDGTLTIEEAFSTTFSTSSAAISPVGQRALKGPFGRFHRLLRRRRQFNPVRRARRTLPFGE